MELVAAFEKRFSGGPTIAVDLRLPVERFGIAVLFGPSGAGKTTVVRVLAGLERPEAGRIRWGDEVWFDAARGIWQPPQHRRVGLVAQEVALFPHLTVAENVAYGLREGDGAARRRRVAELLALVGLEGFGARYPRQLSGGERQRVALARAVAPRPRLLLLDEPLAALDAPEREHLRGQLRRLLRDLALPALVITHDRLEALALGDTMLVLVDGTVRQTGPVAEVFSRPADLAVARLVGVETVVPVRQVGWSDDLMVVEAAGVRLLALAPPNATGTTYYAAIRGEEVLLARAAPESGSARNRLPGRITALRREGPLVRVEVDCGVSLTALLTSQACDEMKLREGEEVVALVKAPAVHLIPRD